MKILAARWSGLARHARPGAFAVLAGLAACAAGAQDLALPAGLTPAAQSGARGRMELSSTTVPLFDGASGATHSTRVDMFWLPPRHPSLGLALGLTSVDAVGFRAPNGPTGPAVDLGLHWRYEDAWRIDVTAWRRMPAWDGAGAASESSSSYGARFEMRMKTSGRRSFGFDRGLLGFQLESGARIGVRRSAGHPMVYYRTSF
jgi:hypothetical protein